MQLELQLMQLVLTTADNAWMERCWKTFFLKGAAGVEVILVQDHYLTTSFRLANYEM